MDVESTINAKVQRNCSLDTNEIQSGTIDWHKTESKSSPQQTTADLFDWSAPVSSAPKDDGFKISWEDEDAAEDDDEPEMSSFAIDKAEKAPVMAASAAPSKVPKGHQLDIMAQQLKFIACLKILMEELSTLATGFEVDGGQLRYQLYVWLEKEVEAMTQLCNYSNNVEYEAAVANADETGGNPDTMASEFDTPPASSKFAHDKPTLHEILLQEKQDFDAKVQRAARRKKWLKANETLLRTLLSYCSLHGASGGGLASVRMELILLLQELQQEKTHQQLLSPLPFPTTLPLLSACVAGNKTVIADPIRYLQVIELKKFDV